MRPRDLAELIALAALWGGSFLFMRVAVPAFGPFALAFLRVFGAALMLIPLLAVRGELAALGRHWRPIAVVGLVNSALPFLCFAYAALTINAGVSAIFNSATPLFAAIVAWFWLGDRMTPLRVVGLAAGFAGVLWIGWDKARFGPGGSAAAIGACLLATMSYGIGPSLTSPTLPPPPRLSRGARNSRNPFSFNVDYEYTMVTGAAHFGTTIADNLSRLFTAAQGFVVDNYTSAAMQAGIWEIMYEHDPTFSLTGGTFTGAAEQTAGNAAFSTVNGFLMNLASYKADARIDVLENSEHQDFLVATIPEPETWMLFGLGLGVVGLLKRRRHS